MADNEERVSHALWGINRNWESRARLEKIKKIRRCDRKIEEQELGIQKYLIKRNKSEEKLQKEFGGIHKWRVINELIETENPGLFRKSSNFLDKYVKYERKAKKQAEEALEAERVTDEANKIKKKTEKKLSRQTVNEREERRRIDAKSEKHGRSAQYEKNKSHDHCKKDRNRKNGINRIKEMNEIDGKNEVSVKQEKKFDVLLKELEAKQLKKCQRNLDFNIGLKISKIGASTTLKQNFKIHTIKAFKNINGVNIGDPMNPPKFYSFKDNHSFYLNKLNS